MWVVHSFFIFLLFFYIFPFAGLVPLYAPLNFSRDEQSIQKAEISPKCQDDLSATTEDREFYEPRRLRIEKIDLDAQIFPVGIDSGGYLALPNDRKSVGWFYEGARVGEPGNLVLAGHFDLPGSKPGVFARLRELAVGDTVIVDSTITYEYVVTSVDWVYENDDQRLERVFTKSDTSIITLITCGGQWQPGKGTYDQRLLIRGVQASSPL
ncbi:MAG: class F sortase [bacterium]|nr:class F sortase [bacterium]